MGKGKQNSINISSYKDEINRDIKNKKYKRYKIGHFYAKDGMLHIRSFKCNVNSIAKRRFINLINSIKAENIKSKDFLNKADLRIAIMRYTEKSNHLITLHDDAKQFLTNKFDLLKIIELYLFSIINNNIFEIDKNNNFNSLFIEKHIGQIYSQQEKLKNAIIKDAFIKATDRIINEKIKHSPKILIQRSSDEIIEYYIDEALTSKNYDPRFDLLKIYRINIEYYYRYYLDVNPYAIINRSSDKLLNINTFYNGSRANVSANALFINYAKYSEGFNKSVLKPFSKQLCAYNLNKQTHLLDLFLMINNADIPFYKIDGLLTKYVLNDIVKDNFSSLEEYTTPDLKGMKLTSIHANENFIINNITNRDILFINSLINRVSKIFSFYYFNNATPKSIKVFIDCIDKEYGLDLENNNFSLPDIIYIDTNSYKEIIEYEQNTLDDANISE